MKKPGGTATRKRKIILTKNQRHLTRRYFIWCHKTTKEELDKVDRYFTQLVVDDYLLTQLRGSGEFKHPEAHDGFKRKVDEFHLYMKDKETNVMAKKFLKGKEGAMNPDYLYLKKRFAAIEKAIIAFLGKKGLAEICELYEGEMTQRILQAKGH